LPFMTTFLFFYNHGTTEWMINIALALFLLAALTDWLSFLLLLGLGGCLGYQAYSLLQHVDNINIIFGNAHKAHLFLYITIFSSLIGMLFSRNREYIQQQVVSLLDNKVRERTKELEEALVLKKEFLNNLSHEIRTPVQGIIVFAQSLYESWHKFTEDKKFTLAKNLNDSVERFQDFVSNILDMSKFETGKIHLDLEQINLAELTEEVITETKSLASHKNLKLLINIKSSSIIAKADRFKIKQVIRNLIANAVKYTKEGEIVITLSEGNVASEDGKQLTGLLLSVSDQGIGIPEQEVELIFEAFTQSSRTKTGAGGRGLSLSVSRRIIDAHLGKIWASNNIPSGATFSFIIPYD